MKPFDDYPELGRTILRKRTGGSARQGYGRWLIDHANQTCCVYCNVSLVDTYENWLLLNVDHVIPEDSCKHLGIPKQWHHSYTNLVLACSGCNIFKNRDSLGSVDSVQPKPSSEWTPSEFIALRDRVFKERYRIIRDRRADEVRFYERNIRR